MRLVVKTRKCSKCGTVKPFSEFHKSSREFGGRKYQCKVCTCEYAMIKARKNGAKPLRRAKIEFIDHEGVNYKKCSKCGLQELSRRKVAMIGEVVE